MLNLDVHFSGLSNIDAADLYDFFCSFLYLYNSNLFVCSSCMISDEDDYIVNSDVVFGDKKFGEIYE